MEQYFFIWRSRFYPHLLGYSFNFGASAKNDSLGGHFVYHDGNHCFLLAQLMSNFRELKTSNESFIIFTCFQRQTDNFQTVVRIMLNKKQSRIHSLTPLHAFID